MEKSAILNADLLDIVFDGRNKEYGAYDLRRSYNKRLRISIAVMMSLALMLCIGQLIASRLPEKKLALLEINDPTLTAVELPQEPVQPPQPELPPPPPAKPMETIKLAPPEIVPDDQVEKTEMPSLDDIIDAKIDVMTQEGEKDRGIVAPPADEGKGIIEAPKPKEKEADIFIPIQKESEYPGGISAWQRYLTRNLRIPQVAIDNGISGTVVVQFVVDKDGNVSNVIALSGPEELRDEAVRVIKKSGKWTPALQNGSHVASYKKQPIVVRIEEQ
jgi:protein TonB